MTSRWMTPRFLIYATGNSLNNIGNVMYRIALPLLVYRLTHSTVSMGITLAVEGSTLLLQPLVGLLVDRMSPRRLLVLSLLYQAIVSAALPLLFWQHALVPILIYLIVFLLALGMDALQAVQTVIIPMMFQDTKDQASAGLTAAYTLTTIVGPLVGGGALAVFGFSTLLWINCLSFLTPIALLPWSRVPSRMAQYSDTTHRPPWWDQTRQGWRELMRHPFTKHLLLSMGAVVMANAAVLPLAEFLLKHAFGLSTALVTGVFVATGVGSFVGAQLPLRLPKLATTKFLGAMIALNVLGLLSMLIPNWLFIPVGLFLGAVGYLGAAVSRNLLLQNHVPLEILGRAMATFRTATGMVAILSPLVMGLIAATWGVRSALVILAVLVAMPLAVLTRRSHHVTKLSRSEV